MPNVFLTPKQVVDGMMESARRQVDKLPLESCRSVFEPWPANGKRVGFGINGALGVAFVLACMERVDREEFAGYGAD